MPEKCMSASSTKREKPTFTKISKPMQSSPRLRPARPELLFELIFPYIDDIVIGVECVFCWYWVADLCSEHKVTFVLGHALYMKAIHGGKTKNDWASLSATTQQVRSIPIKSPRFSRAAISQPHIHIPQNGVPPET